MKPPQVVKFTVSRPFPVLVALLVMTFVSCTGDSGEPAGRELQQLDRSPTQLTPLYEVPEFKLTDQTGNPFGTEQLRGRVWLANFIFTRCVLSCPMQTTKMAALIEELDALEGGEEITYVSISVDPEHDSPEVLRTYGAQYDVDPARWRFLTGERDDIWELSRKGFKLPVEERQMEAGLPLFHSSMIVLLDDRLRVHMYYDGLGDDERIPGHVQALLREKGGSG